MLPLAQADVQTAGARQRGGRFRVHRGNRGRHDDDGAEFPDSGADGQHRRRGVWRGGECRHRRNGDFLRHLAGVAAAAQRRVQPRRNRASAAGADDEHPDGAGAFGADDCLFRGVCRTAGGGVQQRA